MNKNDKNSIFESNEDENRHKDEHHEGLEHEQRVENNSREENVLQENFVEDQVGMESNVDSYAELFNILLEVLYLDFSVEIYDLNLPSFPDEL